MTPIPTYAALLKFMQAQMNRLNMDQRGYDAYAGWADGSAGHILAGDKYLSGPSLFLALNALGCVMQVTEDPVLTARMLSSSRYKARTMKIRPIVRTRVRKHIMLMNDARINGQKGGLKRAKRPDLSDINRRAALTRWARARKAVAT